MGNFFSLSLTTYLILSKIKSTSRKTQLIKKATKTTKKQQQQQQQQVVYVIS